MQGDKNGPHRYDDIIGLPRHSSAAHPHMPVADRAAQFSPFAALAGHGAAIRETARLTDQKIELDENSREILDEKLMSAVGRLGEQPEVAVTYFVPDGRKSGGSYATAHGRVKKLDEYEGLIVLSDGTRIPLGDIIGIETEN